MPRKHEKKSQNESQNTNQMKTRQNQTSLTSKASLRYGLAAAFLLSVAGWGTSCKDTYDLDEKLPSNFGSNLMTYLERNNYENYSQLVKDLGYEEALSGVSLKTLFAADDDAFERFYANNSWGVHEHADLTTALPIRQSFFRRVQCRCLEVLPREQQDPGLHEGYERSTDDHLCGKVPQEQQNYQRRPELHFQ